MSTPRHLNQCMVLLRYGLSEDQVQEATSLMNALMADLQAATKQAAARDAAATYRPLTGRPALMCKL